MSVKVVIDYTNWKGERRRREVIPQELWHGRNEWHEEPQWLLRALDVEKGEMRAFAMRDIHSWELCGEAKT